MKDIIITDLDGTLLNDKKEISYETQKSINNFLVDDNKIFIATGRSPQQIESILKKTNVSSIAITCNGALIIDMNTYEELFSMELDLKKIIKLERIFHKYDVSLNLYGKEKIYYYIEDSRIKEFKDLKKYKLQKIKNSKEIKKPIYKCVFFFETHNMHKKHDIKNEIKKEIEDIELCYSTKNILDITSYGANKGKSIKWLKRNYEYENIVAIGDGENDIDMLREADFSIGMYNSNDAVKKVVDYVTTSNKEEGFSKAINKKIWRKL